METAVSPELTVTLVSAKDAARQLGVSKGTVYALLKGGGLPHVSIGSRKLVTASALRRFAASGGVVARTPAQRAPRDQAQPDALTRAAQLMREAADLIDARNQGEKH